MSVTAERVAVGTSATALNAQGTAALELTIRNAGGASVFLGDASVTASTGLELTTGETMTVRVDGGDRLHAVAATGTEEVHVLRT